MSQVLDVIGEFMPKLEQQTLRQDVCRAEQTLLSIEKEYGKESQQYQSALKRFLRLWFILKMTRTNQEFLHEVN